MSSPPIQDNDGTDDGTGLDPTLTETSADLVDKFFDDASIEASEVTRNPLRLETVPLGNYGEFDFKDFRILEDCMGTYQPPPLPVESSDGGLDPRFTVAPRNFVLQGLGPPTEDEDETTPKKKTQDKKTQDKKGCLTPEHIAQAVCSNRVNRNVFFGSWVLHKDDSGSEKPKEKKSALSTSYDGALDHATNYLKIYGYDLKTHGAHNVYNRLKEQALKETTGLRSHELIKNCKPAGQKKKDGSCVHLYCARCMRAPHGTWDLDFFKTKQRQHLCVTLKVGEEEDDHNPLKVRVNLKLIQVYFHDEQCTTPRNLRRLSLMQVQNLGSGMAKIPCDTEEIVGKKLLDLVGKMYGRADELSENLSAFPEFSKVKNGLQQYRWDNRIDCALPLQDHGFSEQVDNWLMDAAEQEDHQEEVRHMMRRTALYFSNFLGLGYQFSGTVHDNTWFPSRLSSTSTPRMKEHLQLRQAKLTLFGSNEDLTPVHQRNGRSMSDTAEGVTLEEVCSNSDRILPGMIHMILRRGSENRRSMYLGSPEKKISLDGGHMVYIPGSRDCAEMTQRTPVSKRQPLRPMLSLMLSSREQPPEMLKRSYNIQPTSYQHPLFLQCLPPSQQLPGFQVAFGRWRDYLCQRQPFWQAMTRMQSALCASWMACHRAVGERRALFHPPNDPPDAANDPPDAANDPPDAANDPPDAANEPPVAANEPPVAANEPPVAANEPQENADSDPLATPKKVAADCESLSSSDISDLSPPKERKRTSYANSKEDPVTVKSSDSSSDDESNAPVATTDAPVATENSPKNSVAPVAAENSPQNSSTVAQNPSTATVPPVTRNETTSRKRGPSMDGKDLSLLKKKKKKKETTETGKTATKKTAKAKKNKGTAKGDESGKKTAKKIKKMKGKAKKNKAETTPRKSPRNKKPSKK